MNYQFKKSIKMGGSSVLSVSLSLEEMRGKISLEYQKNVLRIMAKQNLPELVKRELEKSQRWFSADQFLELLDWAISELSDFASLISKWFSSFMKPKLS